MKPVLINEIKEFAKHTDFISGKNTINLKDNIKCYNFTENKIARLRYHKDTEPAFVYENSPKDYTELVSKEFREGEPERIIRFGNNEKTLPAIPPHWVTKYKFKPHYKIDALFSTGKGSGTNAVKKVVRESLNDKETSGRVMVHAECIDGHSYPAGFYYKLGFRFRNERTNSIIEDWIKKGSNRRFAPTSTGIMYLPKENIEHCLNYGL